MHKLALRIYNLKIWKDCQGSDMLEYALASGLIALAGVAAMPAYCSTINILLGKVSEIVLNSIH